MCPFFLYFQVVLMSTPSCNKVGDGLLTGRVEMIDRRGSFGDVEMLTFGSSLPEGNQS